MRDVVVEVAKGALAVAGLFGVVYVGCNLGLEMARITEENRHQVMRTYAQDLSEAGNGADKLFMDLIRALESGIPYFSFESPDGLVIYEADKYYQAVFYLSNTLNLLADDESRDEQTRIRLYEQAAQLERVGLIMLATNPGFIERYRDNETIQEFIRIMRDLSTQESMKIGDSTYYYYRPATEAEVNTINSALTILSDFSYRDFVPSDLSLGWIYVGNGFGSQNVLHGNGYQPGQDVLPDFTSAHVDRYAAEHGLLLSAQATATPEPGA
jgi:hypothetical protein